MNKTPPSVGIALAAYAPDPLFFAAQLESIVTQTYQDWVCHVRLDSPLMSLRDDTLLANFFSEPRFIWVENPTRLGHKKNFEAVIQDVANSGVRWIFCCDQDDIWKPQKIDIMVKALTGAPPLSLVHSDMILGLEGSSGHSVWAVERRQIKNCRPQHFLVHNLVTGASAAFDADLASKFPVIAAVADFHDYWFGLMASCHGGVIAVHEPLVIYRQHDGNVVGAKAFRGSYLPQDKSPAAVTRAVNSWIRSHQLMNSVVQCGIELPFWIRAVFGRTPDFGIGLLCLAFIHLPGDRKFARECIIRALGKAVWCLRGRR
jgi:hypothetical protein